MLNRCDFRYVLKVENFRDWRRSTVRLFQARGPATARARSPMRNDQNSNDLYIICKVVVLADYIQSTKILLVHELSVWTVVQTMLTATFNSYGNRQISTPTKSIPLNWSTKKSAQLITSTRGPPIPNMVQIHPLRDSGQMGEITKIIFIYTHFFLRFEYRSYPWMDFYVQQLKRREITQGCAFWGSERCPPKFWG